MKTQLTAHRAATQTRHRIIRKLRADLKKGFSQFDGIGGYIEEELIPWIRSMDERQDKRRGGLGKR